MFFQDRETTMRGIAELGSMACTYAPGALGAEEWVKPTARCDCKYGIDRSNRRFAGGEQTGCPELKSVWAVLDAMSDEEWDLMVRRTGGVQTRKLFNADEPSFEQMAAALRDIETLARQARS